MTAFRFRLASVLRVRESVRDERRAELADALRAADTLSRRLDDVRGELAALRRREAPVGHLEVDQLLAADRYELVLRLDERQLLSQQVLVEAEVARRREALVAADRDVRILEKLRDSQREKHLRQVERAAWRDLDEAAARIVPGEGI